MILIVFPRTNEATGTLFRVIQRSDQTGIHRSTRRCLPDRSSTAISVWCWLLFFYNYHF